MSILGKAADPKFWETVREKDCYKSYRDNLFRMWNQDCTEPIPTLRYSDFVLFKRTGDRRLYETPYFKRRRALCGSAVLALIYPEDEKYINYLMNLIFAICDEYTWALPAHQEDVDVLKEDRLDLFACETGFALSEIYVLLGDRFEPLIRERIKHEIDRRIITPYTVVENYGWWEHGTLNWTAVCSGSIAGTIMHMHPEMAEGLIPRFQKSMECYLNGFKDDGICTEGCSYWHYGFGFFVVYADLIYNFTNGRVDWFKEEKIKTISKFIQNMFLSGQSCVSFSDGNQTLSFNIGLVHYLKDKYPTEVLAYSPDYVSYYDSCGRWCLNLRVATWLNEEYYYNPSDDNVSCESYAQYSEWLVKRTPNYGFAAKGGNNSEPHNHNDIGSFIFAKNGKQILTDLGAGIYNRQYFANDTRYQLIECSSRGHNTPIISGQYQQFGKNFASKNAKFENGVFSLDIAGAYQIDGLEEIKRAFSFTDRTVTLCDKFVYSGEGEIIERLVTAFEPIVKDGEVTVGEAAVKFNSSLCTVKISSENSSKGICWLIDFVLNNGVREISLEIG